MKKTDVLIIGAGLLGCFCALHLRKYNIDVCVLEKNTDVCTGISKANTGIVYSGYDAKPGTLKARLCVTANAGFETLCNRLGVRFNRCGSLLLSFGKRGDEVIRRKAQNGRQNGVSDLKILSRSEILSMEPCISDKVRRALYAGTTGTVLPWELCIAAYECAKSNGATFFFDQEVLSLKRNKSGFIVDTSHETWQAKAVINCAGLNADKIRELCEMPRIRLYPTAADYIVTDVQQGDGLSHILFQEPESKGKGLTLVPTVAGNILIGPTKRKATDVCGFPTSEIETMQLLELCKTYIPGLKTDSIIRAFGSARPDPFYVYEENGMICRGDKDLSGFSVLEDTGLLSFVGIKTPGMTCASELGNFAAEKIASFLSLTERNPDFRLERTPIFPQEELASYVRTHPDYGKIICRCRQISEGEIKEAIRRGAKTIDAVKRRTGAGTGRCQGGVCMLKIARLISEETGIPIDEIQKDGLGSELFI